MTEASSKKQAPARKPRSFSVGEEGNLDKSKAEQSPRKSATAPKKPRKPKAMDIHAYASQKTRKNSNREIVLQPDEAVDEAYEQIEHLTPPVMERSKRSFGWGKLAFSALSALFAIAIGLAIDSLIRDLFARNDWLGWAALGLAAIAAFALLVVFIREIWGLSRLRTLDNLRQSGEKARVDDDLKLARTVSIEIVDLFSSRPDTAHGRTSLSENSAEILDGSDLIHLVERDLLSPLDKTARNMVMESAKRVSIVTAVSPRALVDIGFVLYENMRLIRRICEHYGGRPGTLSSIRLAREVITHLAATGAIAVGDGLLQQVIGQGLAARLSARLGEGVVNGLLTARIGIAAIDVCRPLKFDCEKRPGVSEFLSELVNIGKKDDN